METTQPAGVRDGEPHTARRRRRGLPGVVAAVVLAAAVAVVTVGLIPPDPAGPSAPAPDFSAGRAVEHIGHFAAGPHPTGSPAARAAADYLSGVLRSYGLSPRITTGTAARSFDYRTNTVATVHDVVATIPGTAPTGKLVIAAHYDSVPIGPGASDGGVNVAATLEVARAILAGPRPRNDVDILLTDGEEPGLLGSRAYVDAGGVTDPSRVFVLNSVARGTGGPAFMFQSTDDNASLMTALAAAGTTATSVSNDVYRFLPNDTDLTVFGQAGARGLNYVFVGQSTDYHTTHDSVADVSPSSVQDLGDDLLASGRVLADADLSAAPTGQVTYFTVLGLVVSYPSAAVVPLALLALVGFAALLWFGRRRGLRPGAAGFAGLTLTLPVIAALVIGYGGWSLLLALRPVYEQYGQYGLGDVDRPGPYVAAELCLVAVALLVWFRWMRRRSRSIEEIAAGVLGWLVLLTLAACLVMPSGSYLFLWPALVGIVALAAALRWSAADSPWRTYTAVAPVLPAALLILPVAELMFPTLGLSGSAAPLVLVTVVAAGAVVLLEPVPRRIVTAATAGVVVVAVLLGVVGFLRDTPDTRFPSPVSLGYAYDADTGRAQWLSLASTTEPAFASVLTGPPVHIDVQYPTIVAADYRSGPAPVVASAVPPSAVPVGPETVRDGVREQRVHVSVPAQTEILSLYLDTSVNQVVDATANGARLDGGTNLTADRGPWRWGVRYGGPPPQGVDLTVRVRGTGPIRLLAIAEWTGLPAGAPALPADRSWAPWPSIADQTLAARTFRF